MLSEQLDLYFKSNFRLRRVKRFSQSHNNENTLRILRYKYLEHEGSIF